MATTSPDNLFSPNPTDNYNLIADWATSMQSVQTALTRRANMYVGTSTQRSAFTTAPEGVHWQDTDGQKREYVRQGSAWVSTAVEDTGWVNCTLAPGVSLQGGTPPSVRRVGTHVQLQWGVAGSGFSANSGKDAFTIPAGFRPVSFKYLIGAGNTAASTFRYSVAATGVVAVQTGGTVPSYLMFDSGSWYTD